MQPLIFQQINFCPLNIQSNTGLNDSLTNKVFHYVPHVAIVIVLPCYEY